MQKTLLLFFSVTAAGCLTPAGPEALLDAVQEYNYGLRWGRSEWMKGHLSRQGLRLVAERQTRADLQITGCEVEGVMQKAEGQAVASVRVDWYLSHQNRVFSSLVQQTWKITAGRWQLVDQRVAQGAPFPLVVHGS